MQLQRRQATLPTANNGDACAAFPTMQKVAATEGKNTLLGYKSESRPPASVEVFSISREGSVWRLTYQGKTIHHKDIMGLRYIELLTRSPGEPINVNALYRVVTPPPPEVVGSALSEQNDEELGEEGLIKGQLADREEQIDQKTVNQSKQHLIKLKDLIEDAKERGDESKKAAYENEWEQIMKYLSANLGKDGQPRNTNRIDERIRKSVWKTINDAIKSISSQDSAIGAHLRACISTGNTPLL